MQASLDKAVILAHRLSLSYLPGSKVIAKEMLPLLNKPVIQWIVEELQQAGIEHILIVAGFQKQQLEAHFSRHLEWESLLQSEKSFRKQEELAKLKRLSVQVIQYHEERHQNHPLLEASVWIGDDPFLLVESEHLIAPCPPYPIASIQLVRQHNEWGCPLIGVHTCDPERQAEGAWLHSAERNLSAGETAPIMTINRQQAQTQLLPAGRYILQSSVLKLIRQSSMELTLIDILRLYNQQTPMLAYHFQGAHLPLYSPSDLFRANLFYAQHNPLYREELKRWADRNEASP